MGCDLKNNNGPYVPLSSAIVLEIENILSMGLEDVVAVLSFIDMSSIIFQ